MSLVECSSVDGDGVAVGCSSYKHSKLFLFISIIESCSGFDGKWHRYILTDVFNYF
jgi:hypothetical protein